MAEDSPRLLGAEPIGAGQWLSLERLAWRDRHGQARSWEAVRRTGGRGAVAVAAVLRPSARLVVVRQFRPPAGGQVLEFPAGLLDGDEEPAAAALRELREETGYHGALDRLLPPSFSSPGLTGEAVHLALVSVDEAAAANRAPVPAPEAGEDLEVLLVPLAGLRDFLLAARERGDRVDAKLFLFAVGLGLASP